MTDKKPRRFVAYAEAGPGFCFALLPGVRGYFIRTARCVAFVPCSVCDAHVCEPWRSSAGEYKAETHYKRRYAYTAFKKGILPRSTLSLPVLETQRTQTHQTQPEPAAPKES